MNDLLAASIELDKLERKDLLKALQYAVTPILEIYRINEEIDILRAEKSKLENKIKNSKPVKYYSSFNILQILIVIMVSLVLSFILFTVILMVFLSMLEMQGGINFNNMLIIANDLIDLIASREADVLNEIFLLLGIVLICIFIIFTNIWIIKKREKRAWNECNNRMNELRNQIQNIESNIILLKTYTEDVKAAYDDVYTYFTPNYTEFPQSLIYIIRCLENYEVSNWKEGVATYKEFVHRNNLESIAFCQLQVSEETKKIAAKSLAANINAEKNAKIAAIASTISLINSF